MRFRRGTKVGITYIDRRGKRRSTQRWWSQVDAFCTKMADAGAGTDFWVRGLGWKAARRWRAKGEA